MCLSSEENQAFKRQLSCDNQGCGEIFFKQRLDVLQRRFKFSQELEALRKEIIENLYLIPIKELQAEIERREDL